MFGLFKRTKIESWELQMLVSILKLLPEDYNIYLKQIEQGNIRGVMLNMSDIPNFVGFRYKAIPDKDQIPVENNFMLSNIELINRELCYTVSVSVYFAFGIITGYSFTEKIKNFNMVNFDISLSNMIKKSIGNVDYDSISNLFSKHEMSLIDPSDVYATKIGSVLYYHLKELEDGDFIAIDSENQLFIVNHDPFEIISIERNELSYFLSDKR